MATFSVIDTGSGADTFYEGMVKDAANWAILEAMLSTGFLANNIAVGSDANGDIYYRGSGALARLAKGTAYLTLGMNSGATAPEWQASLKSIMTAQGDIVYATGANTPARLAKGTAYQVLRMNSGATAPEWSVGTAFKVVAETRAMDAASGDVAYTAAGFTPQAVVVLAAKDGGTSSRFNSTGVATGASTAQGCIWGGGCYAAAKLVYAYEDTGKSQDAVLKTLDADGTTLTWTRTGVTASGTLNLYILYLR